MILEPRNEDPNDPGDGLGPIIVITTVVLIGLLAAIALTEYL